MFTRLGNLGQEYQIQLQSDAQLFALHTARTVLPISLHNNVQAELNHIEREGITSKADEPTPWCAGMVLVPKSQVLSEIALT